MSIRDLFDKKTAIGKPQPVDDTTFAAEVLGSTTPVLVDFWAPWCAPCRLVGGLLDEIAPEYHGRLRFVKLNVDENPQTAARFGISSIPTLILIKEGKAVDHLVGAVPMRPLRQWLDRHAVTSPGVES